MRRLTKGLDFLHENSLDKSGVKFVTLDNAIEAMNIDGEQTRTKAYKMCLGGLKRLKEDTDDIDRQIQILENELKRISHGSI